MQQRAPRQPELQNVTQDELKHLAEIDDYINILRWQRARKAMRIIRRIQNGAEIERGQLRPIIKKRSLEVRSC